MKLKDLKERFKPIHLSVEKWDYQGSINKIIKSSFSPVGTVDFTVKFRDGQIKKIPSKSLKNDYSQLIKQFEVIKRNKSINIREKAKSTKSRNNRRISYRKEESDEEGEEEGSDFEDEDDIDFLEEQVNSKTSRGRLTVKPKSFQNEFYPDRPEEQISRKPMSVYVPPYTDDLFLEYHSERCLRCYKFGNPTDMSNNGDGKVQIGSQSKRARLLLCQSCSVSMHNNCISTHKLIDKTTKNLKCPKCVRGTNCSRCDTSILKTKGSKEIPFRCFTCNTAYHHDCIIPGTSSELRDKLKSMDLVDLYRDGQCIECSTFLKDKKPQAVADERKVDGRLEYFIKWKDLSYRHASWVSAKWIANYSTTLHRGYIKRKEKEGPVPLSEDVVCIDRILDVVWTDKSHTEAKKVLAVFKDTEYADAVWDEPPLKDDERLYTDYENALKRYIQASKVLPPRNMKGLIANVRSAATSESYKSRELKAQPDFIKGGTLMKHQLEALNWLLYQWEKRMPCILADDMGLGKTIQVISLLFYLYRKFLIYPFFIVVPNSTATNWVREFTKWAPELIVVPYFGQAAARKLALENEIFDAKGQLKCHVVIATYESACEPSKLHDVFWPVLIVDESQRLKNDESLLFKTLARLRVDHIVLLTGTPLQNRLRELFNIMHFIRPLEFKGDEADHYEEMTKPQIDELHSRLKPYFLRRTKQEVLKKLPPKYELIVPVSMTALQKEVYKLCLSSEIIETLSEATGTKRQKGLSSIFTNLRKTLNHPYLLDGVELEQSTPEEVQQSMIEACGKLKLFHQMLPKILEQGHRILIFSTMTRNLDIIEDYLDYELVKYVRIDGSAKEANRVKAIDAFNAPNSNINVFLLSTRAGGVGINLATADTVIIWDSDFNPYADLQAISRAHRIGQANMVIIYRFMTRLSVEEKILQIGKKKMALEHVVVERMKADEEENIVEDLESILKFGTEALFDNDDSKDIRYDDSAIANLLNREQYREAATELQIKEVEELEGIDKEQGTMNFSFAKVWQADGTTEELKVDETETPNESDFWDKFLIEQQTQKEKKKQAKREAELTLGRGGRKRTAVSYVESTTKLLPAEIGHKLATDEEFVLRQDDDSDDDDDDDHGDLEADLTNDIRSAKKLKLDESDAPQPKRARKSKKQIQAGILNGQQQQQQQQQQHQTVQPQKEKRRPLTEWEWVIAARHQEVMWNSIVLPGILDIITKYRVEHRTTIDVPTLRYREMKNIIVAEIWRLVHEFSKKEMDREYIHEIESGVSQKVATDRFHLKFAFYNQNVNLILHQVIQGYINFYENEVYFELKAAEIKSSIGDPILKSEQLNSLKETHKLLQTQLNGIAANATTTFNMAFERIIALRPATNTPKKVSYSSIHPAPNAETSAVNFQHQFKINPAPQPQVRPLNTASPQYNNNGQQTTFTQQQQQQQQSLAQQSAPIAAQSPAPITQSPAPLAQYQSSTKAPPIPTLAPVLQPPKNVQPVTKKPTILEQKQQLNNLIERLSVLPTGQQLTLLNDLRDKSVSQNFANVNRIIMANAFQELTSTQKVFLLGSLRWKLIPIQSGNQQQQFPCFDQQQLDSILLRRARIERIAKQFEDQNVFEAVSRLSYGNIETLEKLSEKELMNLFADTSIIRKLTFIFRELDQASQPQTPDLLSVDSPLPVESVDNASLSITNSALIKLLNDSNVHENAVKLLEQNPTFFEESLEARIKKYFSAVDTIKSLKIYFRVMKQISKGFPRLQSTPSASQSPIQQFQSHIQQSQSYIQQSQTPEVSTSNSPVPQVQQSQTPEVSTSNSPVPQVQQQQQQQQQQVPKPTSNIQQQPQTTFPLTHVGPAKEQPKEN